MSRKLRPYRVDYFNAKETDGIGTLVHSVVVRAVTSAQAADIVRVPEEGDESARIVVRSYRFYGKAPKRPRFELLTTLFKPAKLAYIKEHLLVINPKHDFEEAVLEPTSGPDSAATQEVVADLNGMVNNDAHEKTFETFVPAASASTPSFDPPVRVSDPVVEPRKPSFSALHPEGTYFPPTTDPETCQNQLVETETNLWGWVAVLGAVAVGLVGGYFLLRSCGCIQ